MTDPAPDPEIPARQRWIILATCCFALFIGTLDNTVANVALPSIQHDFRTSLQNLQWIVDSYILVRGSLLFTAGAIGDRWGRRRTFQQGLVLFGISSILCSVAPNADLLIAARVLQAVGGAMLTPTSLAIITNTFTDHRERARALGFWGATVGLSTGLGPVVGGALVDGIGWRSVFWINVPVVILAFVLAARTVPESTAKHARRMDLPGQLLIFVTLSLATYALIEAPQHGWGSLHTVGILIGSLLIGGLFVAVERHRREPLIDLDAFRSASFNGVTLVAILAFVAFVGFIFVNTLYLQEVRGDTPLQAGLLTIPATLGGVFLSPLSGWITSHRGPRLPLTIASVLMAAGLYLLATLSLHASLLALLGSYLVLGLGFGMVNAPITTAAMAGMPRERAGIAGAMTSAARQVGSALGTALLGSLAFGSANLVAAGGHHGISGAAGDHISHGLSVAYVVAGSMSVLAAVIGLLLMGNRAPQHTPA